MELTSQKTMAAKVLGVGKNRVWIDPEQTEKVKSAITRQDIRNLIDSGIIKKVRQKGHSKTRAKKIRRQKARGRRKGKGSIKGNRAKEDYVIRVRSLKKELKRLRESYTLTQEEYWVIYRRIKGGFFRNKKHMETHIKKKMRELE